MLYRAACRLAARYLDHMDLEETELEPVIRGALSDDEIRAAGAQSVARTPEAHRPSMLGFIVAALPRAEADAMLARVPAALAEAVRAQLGRT